jgi:hypothetical protein
MQVTGPRGVNTKYTCSGERGFKLMNAPLMVGSASGTLYAGSRVFSWLLRCWEGVIRSTALGQELSVDCNTSITLVTLFCMEW